MDILLEGVAFWKASWLPYVLFPVCVGGSPRTKWFRQRHLDFLFWRCCLVVGTDVPMLEVWWYFFGRRRGYGSTSLSWSALIFILFLLFFLAWSCCRRSYLFSVPNLSSTLCCGCYINITEPKAILINYALILSWCLAIMQFELIMSGRHMGMHVTLMLMHMMGDAQGKSTWW
jgi:hypothetical protein